MTDDNEHLGLIVSGQDEEAKNVDQNIQQARSSLFALLGVAFSFKSKVSPSVQIHLWRTYCQPILRSGLAALPVRPAQSQFLTLFHHKVLRGFLKLSSTSPIPALYFLLGEMPIQAHIHLDVLGLFHTIWSNPGTTIHEIIKYIVKMSDDNSVTWALPEYSASYMSFLILYGYFSKKMPGPNQSGETGAPLKFVLTMRNSGKRSL